MSAEVTRHTKPPCPTLAFTHPLDRRRQHRSQKTVPPWQLLAAIAQNHDAPERDGGTERHSVATLVSAASPESELARLREAACEVWPGARVTAELTTRRGGR